MTFIVPIVSNERVKRTYLNSMFLEVISNPQVSLTFSNRDFGAAFTSRRLIAALGIHYAGGTAITNVVMGGITADIIATVNNAAGGAVIAIAHVPTGATGNVTVTGNGTLYRAFGAFYSVSGLDHNAIHAKLEVAGNGGNLNVPAVGICVGVNLRNFGGISWSGLAEDVEESQGGAVTGSAASAEFASDISGHTVSTTGGSTSSLCAASWGP